LSNIRQLNEMVLHKLPLFQNVFLFDWQFSCANLLTNEKEINDNTHFIFLCINLLLKQKLLESLHKMYIVFCSTVNWTLTYGGHLHTFVATI
jgi:hypothetical protein